MRELIFHLFSFSRIRTGTLTSAYTFIRYIPVVFVMSESHNSGYAMIWMDKGSEIPQIEKIRFAPVLSFREREMSGYGYQTATDRAMTDNRDNDTPVRS